LNVQVRDAALVVMMHLTGQQPADYGYLHARLTPQRTFQLQTLHRENDEQRAAAVAKWRSWRATSRRAGVEGDQPPANDRQEPRVQQQQHDPEIEVPGFKKLED
jgi:hypothetical protein